ncbi:MAG TPA: ABC transporter permease, partial [Bryobacteraceae bacterium]|nr:ABC transporter permease [Bryobacteraceae bacterium]
SAVLWTPLPYPGSNRLFVLKELDPRNGVWPFSEPDFVDVRDRSRSVETVGAFRRGVSALTGAGEPEMIRSVAVTPSCFEIFGIRPVAGRAFQGSRNSVVISRGLWERRWQLSPDVIGQPIALDGESYTVAGVADLPRDIFPGAELLLPLLPQAVQSRTAHEIEAVGRLRGDVDISHAQAELNVVAASIARDNPQSNTGWNIRLVPLADYLTGPRANRMVRMIFGAVALLWLLACANVAGMQIARSIARRHEMSTRLALGASTVRLVGQALTDNLVLACFGSAPGLVIARVATDLIRSLGSQSLPRLAAVRMASGTAGIALGCVLASTLLCTLFSGRPTRFQGTREVSRRDRGRDALIVAQVALASVLVLGASLLLQSFLRLRGVDPGFDPERILAVQVNLPSAAYSGRRSVEFFRAATERLTRLPEVASVGASNVVPFSGEGTANRFRVEGEPGSTEFRVAAWRAVTPGFFTVLGMPLKRGRLFTERDANGSPEVVILSESMARKFWPGQDPIGKRLLWGSSGHPKTIVGIVGDLRDLAVDIPPGPTMFRPFAQLSDAPMTLLIRTRRDASSSTVSDIRHELWSVDRDVALQFQSVARVMSESIPGPRVGFLVFAAFALIAIVTAGFGLYGLIAYRVNQRQQEIGIRLALGCPAGAVRWGVQKHCLILAFSGLAIGLPAAYALSALMRSLLYETQPTDAGAYAIALIVLGAVSLAASYGPASRAASMDPAASIRYE